MHRHALPEDGAPTTGYPILDLLTTALGMHLFVDPAVVDALCVHWIANAVPTQQVAPTATQELTSLINRIVRDTHVQDVGLVIVPTQRNERMEFIYHIRFFADRSDLGIVGSVLENAKDPVFASVVNVLGRLNTMKKPPAFNLRGRDGVGGEIKLADFLGNARLRHYVDPVYILRVILWRFVEAMWMLPTIAKMSDDRRLVGLGAMWDTVSMAFYKEMKEMDDPTHAADDTMKKKKKTKKPPPPSSPSLRDECETNMKLFFNLRMRTEELVRVLAQRAEEMMQAARVRLSMYTVQRSQQTASDPMDITSS